jgi:ElaB/YqjD/DUF883 family membrane-anchored ribosome-binding protein
MSSTDGEDAMKTMTDKATYDRLQKDLAAVKNDISALADQISDVIDAFKGDARKQAKKTYKQARSNVDSMVSDIGQRGNDALEAAQDYAGTLEESLEDAITQRPLAAVGLAVGLGFLIGVTWRR